ncbi:MAG: PA2779 family protein [Elusimicrobiota bacterium]
MKNSPKALIFALILSTTLVCTLSVNGRAMLAPTQGMSRTEGSDRASDMKTVQSALESKVLRARLRALGLSDQEIDSRLSQLSDAEIHRLAKDIGALGAGGDLGGILVLVLLVLLIVYLIHRI